MKKRNVHWTLNTLLENRHLIEFPEYQREPTVWNLEKKQRLIDSILRDFDIASIYFFKKSDATYGVSYDCIDGRQRINAILSYFGENKDDNEHNDFRLTMVNEIYDDSSKFDEVNTKRFKDLPEVWQHKITNYSINIVEIEGVDAEEELNLLFLRLQLGQILNAGEKLHAMTGAMREYIFNDIGKHAFFQSINIPYRRFAREQVASQITLNYFSRKESGEFRRSRYIDLQDFFKKRSEFSENDGKLSGEIRERLDTLCVHLNDKLGLIENRALAVSLFLFVSELIDQGRDGEIDEFTVFLVKFLKTLKWQIPKGVQMDSAYHYLLDFQTYVTQAAGEKYAIQNRHDFLNKAFHYHSKKKAIDGDDRYLKTTGKRADEERGAVKL